jgi:cysteine desulfurase
MKPSIYLDYAAATPMRQEVVAAMQTYYSDNFYNPSATYLAARAVRRDLQSARASVAGVLGAKPSEIIFTAGATEANNLAVHGIMSQYPDGELLISSIEHESVAEPSKAYKTAQVPVDKSGQIILNKLSNLISDKTTLISIILVNNEFGVVQSLREINTIIDDTRRQRQARGNRRPLHLHTDAAQAGNYLDLQVARLGVGLMSLNGGKLYGPKQSGCLYVKAGTNLKPIIVGGGQEFGLRSGTENVAGIIGFAKAFELAQNNRSKEAERVVGLRDSFETKLSHVNLGIQVNGSGKHRVPHISNLTFNGLDNERLLMELDELGIMCAVGSACSASSQEPSKVLKAIGLNDDEARSSLRFSFGKDTTQKDIEEAVGLISNLIKPNR